MNDPGLDNPIADETKVIDQRKQADELDEIEEDEQSFLSPSRWWFASTAFPLIAGTFGPMASAFSICALVTPWRVSVAPGQSEADGMFVDDPSWLVGINAAQLALALISNLFLLLNMARRVRFSIAQPVTITGWYISSFTLIGLTATAAGPLQLSSPPDHALSQAFYYAIFAACLYLIVASMMAVTVVGAYMGRYEKDFNLTISQRTLMLQSIIFLIYMLLGAMVFAHIENWTFLDAVYFTDFTLLTVGIGDLAPSTDLGRGLLFPYAICGIIIIGLVIGSIRSLVLERGKVKLGARMVEKERRRILKKSWKEAENLLIPIHDGKKTIPGNTGRAEADQEVLTERLRREKEFHLMRRVQERATRRRQWTSLAISALTWFALWFLGAVVFYAAEASQQWSYFTAVYFSYTSLLTIGYGDIYPISNAGRSFFVFWSLLAVPSLTILISNMGDTIVKTIRDLTLKIGNLTILPNDSGVRNNAKQLVRTLSLGKLFSEDVKELLPGFIGESNQKRDGDDDNGEGGASEHHPKNDPESAAQRVASGQARVEADRAKQEGESGDVHAIPESKTAFHSLLIKEISSVIRHLNSSPPRKYTFDEWAWYLKLMGEDESNHHTHRSPPKGPRKKGEDMGATTGKQIDEDKKTKWSWVGLRSPLMGNKEEAEWVLERLVATLGKELKAKKEDGDGSKVANKTEEITSSVSSSHTVTTEK